MLKLKNIEYEYEPDTFTLMPKVKGTLGPIAPITYTPDYKLTINGKTVWVEVKGFARPADLLKSKLADWYFTNKRNESYLMVGSFGGAWSGLKSFYIYKYKNRISNIEKGLKSKRVIKRDNDYLTQLFGNPEFVKFKTPCTFWEDLEKLTA